MGRTSTPSVWREFREELSERFTIENESMFDVLNERFFEEYYTTGFVRTKRCLPAVLVDAIHDHYTRISSRNDICEYAFNAKKQASYLAKNASRENAGSASIHHQSDDDLVKRIDKKYRKSIYAEQKFIQPIAEWLLTENFAQYFKTRYLVISHDIYLGHDMNRTAFSMHADVPNFDHFYETENDLSLLIPLVDFCEEDGGRIQILPECKMKVPINILLVMIQDHFLPFERNLDAKGYVDTERISEEELECFKESECYLQFLEFFGVASRLAATYQQHGYFQKGTVSRGEVVMFNNRNFHAIEPWSRVDRDRELYLIRCLPVYDVKISLPAKLHGKLFNNFLMDFETHTIQRFDGAVDLGMISDRDKLHLRTSG